MAQDYEDFRGMLARMEREGHLRRVKKKISPRDITALCGQARAAMCSVTDADAVQAMADATLAEWGRIDILVNNAGILRDKSFAKMTLDDFRLVVDVHLMGSVICTKAVWDLMREQAYGRHLAEERKTKR